MYLVDPNGAGLSRRPTAVQLRSDTMIVEFVGCTGSGKTTLARRIAGGGFTTTPARTWTDLVTDRRGLRGISDPHAINLLADVFALPAFVRSLSRERDFLRLAFDRLGRHAPSTFAKLNYSRNLVRKLGIHELATRADPATTLLVDEGTILTAYQLFVYSNGQVTRGDLERFVALVPLPDQVVYVKAPIDVLVRRALTRPDRRRELAAGNQGDLERWIVRAVELFDALVELEPIRSRLLTVEVADDTPESVEATARSVGAWIDRSRDAMSRPDVPADSRRVARAPARRRTATLIAFVGSEATGKSTILHELEGRLRRTHRVRRVHAGKPPSTPLTFVPHVLLPAVRKLFPDQRTLRVEERHGKGEGVESGTFPLLFGIRSVMLAYERRALLRAAVRGGTGTIVLSDRFPSDASGAPDGPQLAQFPMPSRRYSLRRWLAALEGRLYRDIPAPDLVFHLWAPLQVTLARNAARDKREPEEYVRFRHSLSSTIRFDEAPVHRIDTDRPLELVMGEIEGLISDGSPAGR